MKENVEEMEGEVVERTRAEGKGMKGRKSRKKKMSLARKERRMSRKRR